MAFADPQSFTPTGGSAISLPRVSQGILSGQFQSADALTTLSINHSVGRDGIKRHFYRLDQQKLASDPFVPANSRYSKAYAYVVLGQPTFGYTAAEVVALAGGLLTGLTASTNAKLTQLVGQES